METIIVKETQYYRNKYLNTASCIDDDSKAWKVAWCKNKTSYSKSCQASKMLIFPKNS